jgi:hypothetical protein
MCWEHIENMVGTTDVAYDLLKEIRSKGNFQKIFLKFVIFPQKK